MDDEIKEDILGGEDKTLADTVKTVEAKELAKCTKAMLRKGEVLVSKAMEVDLKGRLAEPQWKIKLDGRQPQGKTI